MTGHQENPGTGQTLRSEPTFAVDFAEIAKAIGIAHVYTVDAYDLGQVETALRAALEAEGPAVVVVERACALLPEARSEWQAIEVDPDLCTGCADCFGIACPAIIQSDQLDHRPDMPRIDSLLCTGCEICAQVCHRGAILFREQAVDQETV
jgi:indolepyruvate ferredoxin oxidoreductase alpha subunit